MDTLPSERMMFSVARASSRAMLSESELLLGKYIINSVMMADVSLFVRKKQVKPTDGSISAW